MPNLEQVTCSEPMVTPINSAISSRLLPRSTRLMICCTLSGVNLIGLPPALVTLSHSRPGPFFAFFTLVILLAAALRWDWQGVLATGAAKWDVECRASNGVRP